MASADAPDVPIDWSQALRRRGYRSTPQRARILDAVAALGHATPEAVAERAGVELSTVYRTLDLLDRLGVVRHTHLGHGAPTYSSQGHEHVHLVCHLCGTVTEVPVDLMAGVAGRVADDYGFTLDVAHVALSGLCRDCRARDAR